MVEQLPLGACLSSRLVRSRRSRTLGVAIIGVQSLGVAILGGQYLVGQQQSHTLWVVTAERVFGAHHNSGEMDHRCRVNKANLFTVSTH